MKYVQLQISCILPLEIKYKPESKFFRPPNTIIFKNKWYSQSALFTSKINNNSDFIIKDRFKNFTDIFDIHDFFKEVLKYTNEDMIYEGKSFFVDDVFKKYIEHLTKSKRYNLRTNKHIISNKQFDKKDYQNYMTHEIDHFFRQCPTFLCLVKVLLKKLSSYPSQVYLQIQ